MAKRNSVIGGAVIAILLGIMARQYVISRPVTVRIDEGHVLFTTSSSFHGTNFVALWNETGASDGTRSAFSQLGSKLLRFPGGVPCQWYDWQDPLATGWTKVTPLQACGLAQAGNAEMLFQTNTANSRSGVDKQTGKTYRLDNSGSHAAAWVQWAKQNRVHVAGWEIGNEPEMDAPLPAEDKKDQGQVYAWYNRKFSEQAQAMKQADPSIKLIGPASTNTYYWWTQHNLEKFMQAHGNRQGDGLVDAISVHWYPNTGSGPWTKRRGLAQDWQSCMDYIQSVIHRYDSRELPVYLTEWNWRPPLGDTKKRDRAAAQLGNALGCADCIGMFLKTGVSGQLHFCLQHIDHNWGVLSEKGEPVPENSASPTYFALAMASRLWGQALDTHCSGDERNTVSAYATRHDGNLQVLLINKTERAKKVDLHFMRSLPPYKRVQLYSLCGINSKVTDEEILYNGIRNPHPSIQPLPSPLDITVPEARSRLLPPYSMEVLIFTPA